MKIKDPIKHPRGYLHMVAYGADGRQLWYDDGNNLIVSSGYEALSDCFTGNANASVSHIEVGTRGDIPIPADAVITEPVRIEATITSKGAAGFRLDFTIGYAMANGMQIREFGIITKDGRLFSRKVRAAIEKTEAMTIVGQWDINF